MDTHVEDHRHQAVLGILVGLTDIFHPGLILVAIFPDAEHVAAGLALVVTVGESLAVESIIKLLFHGSGHNTGVDGLAIDLGDSSYILSALHTALQFQRSHTHLFQFLHIVHQAIVL